MMRPHHIESPKCEQSILMGWLRGHSNADAMDAVRLTDADDLEDDDAGADEFPRALTLAAS